MRWWSLFKLSLLREFCLRMTSQIVQWKARLSTRTYLQNWRLSLNFKGIPLLNSRLKSMRLLRVCDQRPPTKEPISKEEAMFRKWGRRGENLIIMCRIRPENTLWIHCPKINWSRSDSYTRHCSKRWFCSKSKIGLGCFKTPLVKRIRGRSRSLLIY